MQHDSATPGGHDRLHPDFTPAIAPNGLNIAALLHVLDALAAAENTIDEVGLGTETIYQTLLDARANIEKEIAELVVLDALCYEEARP
jgi:hypothetical protein